jgi:hypothetical protein
MQALRSRSPRNLPRPSMNTTTSKKSRPLVPDACPAYHQYIQHGISATLSRKTSQPASRTAACSAAQRPENPCVMTADQWTSLSGICRQQATYRSLLHDAQDLPCPLIRTLTNRPLLIDHDMSPIFRQKNWIYPPLRVSLIPSRPALLVGSRCPTAVKLPITKDLSLHTVRSHYRQVRPK